MSCQQSPLRPLGPLTTLPSTTAGLFITEHMHFGIASVLVQKGKTKALAERLSNAFKIELPARLRYTASGALALTATAPGAWLAMYEKDASRFTTSLAEAIGDVAAISDQTDAYTVLRLSGSHTRDVLSRLVPIDLHPRVFEVYECAATVAAHIGVMLWRLGDSSNGTPVFQIAIPRSLTSSFCEALAFSIPPPKRTE